MYFLFQSLPMMIGGSCWAIELLPPNLPIPNHKSKWNITSGDNNIMATWTQDDNEKLKREIFITCAPDLSPCQWSGQETAT